VEEEEGTVDVETMARMPQSLGNQFPLKNPKGSMQRKKRGATRRETDLLGSGPRRVSGVRREGSEEGLGGVEEFDETSAPVFGGEEVVGSVMINGVQKEAAGLPKGVAVEEDVGHCPKEAAMRAVVVIVCGRAEGGGVVRVESVMGCQLKGGALEST
jgi:hypothetical protein